MGDNTHNMKISNLVLLLIAAALFIQALGEMDGEDELAGLGRGGKGPTPPRTPPPTTPPPTPPPLRKNIPLLPGQCHKEAYLAMATGNPPQILYGCKTCSGSQTTRSYGTAKLNEQCTSCGTTIVGNEEHNLFLVAKKFKVHEGKHVPEGRCELLPSLGEFDPSLKSVCKDTPCYDGSTGYSIGNGINGKSYGSTDKTVCSRLCLLGGALTRVTNLERYDKPEKGTGKRQVGAKFYSQKILPKGRDPGSAKMSEPVCGLHKTVTCTKNKDYDLVNCQKFMAKKADGKSTHCKKENCSVQKNIHCVAILPRKQSQAEIAKRSVEKISEGSTGTHKGNEFMKENEVFSKARQVKVFGVKPDTAYTNECKYAINPCDMVALYV